MHPGLGALDGGFNQFGLGIGSRMHSGFVSLLKTARTKHQHSEFKG